MTVQKSLTRVGVIVNPQAGKDIRRLASAASHTSDVAKMGIVRRVTLGAIEAGVDEVLLSADRNHLSARAIDGLNATGQHATGQNTALTLLETPGTGSRHDTITAARAMRDAEVGVVVVLGGDGTCRDVSVGWPDAPCIAISTGTNNVFPVAVDATSAGLAAGLIATGTVPLATVSRQAKRIIVEGTGVGASSTALNDTALVDVALINTAFIGARAVKDAASINAVVACIAEPASTGLSSIAGQILPTDRSEDGGVFLKLAAEGTPVRVPISPGAFSTVNISDARRLDHGETVSLRGPGVLAFDGERHLRLETGQGVTLRVERDGPHIINVSRALHCAVAQRQGRPKSQ